MSFGSSCGGGERDGRIIAAVDLLAYGGGSNMPSGAISHPRLATSSSLPKSSFNSPALSLALQTSGEGLTGMPPPPPVSSGGSGGATRRSREEDLNEISRSGSGDMDGAPSGDDLDGYGADFPPRKKRYHRHTPQQIQELEALFKECPHPDEKQRLELSRRLSLETRQVKFWFQNRRTQMKTQLERHENSSLRQDNEKLRAENMSIRDAMRSPICTNCGGPALIGDFSLEEQHLRIENARLKDELDRVCNLAGKFLGHRPVPSSSAAMLPPSSGLELGVGAFTAALPLGPGDFVPSCRPTGSAADCNGVVNGLNIASGRGGAGIDRSVLLEVALGAMEELLRMAQGDDSLWVRSMDGGREVLNREEYTSSTAAAHSFSFTGLKPSQASQGFASEASRESGMVIINSLALVETLMDSNRWAEMFPCMIGRTSTEDVISRGVGGTRDGALQLMHAELQLLSPLVPVRGVTFLRFCKQQAEGVWAVVDVSVDIVRQGSGSPMYVNCRRFPSGCVVQDMPNGYSKVTWVEHAEYDETAVHHLYRPMVGAGMGFGAQRWVATLQRQCQCLAILMSSSLPSPDQSNAITASGRRSMLKLAQRMTDNFCTGVCASSVHKWNKLCTSHVDEDVRVMTRKSVDDPGEPPGVVLSAATSVWLPISPHRLFDFLRDERLRSQWDILSNGGPMMEMAHIAKGQDHGNCVSLLRATAMNANQSSMLILQETCIDASGSLVVYAPVDIPAMHVVMNGGDSACVALLPSGFAIAPDGPGSLGGPAEPKPNGPGPQSVSSGGSLLTVAFQILVNSLPTAKLTVESVETVNNLISCTVQKIKAALHCES